MKRLQDKRVIICSGLAVFLIAVLLPACAIASGIVYPTDGLQIARPEEQGMRSEMLAEMMAYVHRFRFEIDSISIVRNGHLVLDAAFFPYIKGQKHNIHSCTKSVMSALIGIAIDKGYIQNIDQSIMEFFPEKVPANMDAHKQAITLEHVLMMASGLACKDSYLYNWMGLNELRRSDDWVRYILDLPMAEAPGDTFEYCNGASFLLSAIIRKTSKMNTMEFARKHFFKPLGIVDVDWETSPQGIDIGWGEMWLKPQDMAKIGWLYLNKGKWAGRQVVPAAWVEVSTRGHIDALLFDQYGYQWWVDSAGYYMAVGYGGQYIFVVPQKGIVAVFTSDLDDEYFPIPRKLLNKYIIPAASSTKALPANVAEQARLDAIVTKVAKERGFTWTLAQAGRAKQGVFQRTASPAFKFEYPLGSRKLVKNFPDQVMRMKTPGNVEFSASVGPIPTDLKLKDFGPTFFAKALTQFGRDIRVVSNKEFTLACGTPAYRTDITWMWQGSFPLTTYLVSAFKDGQYVYVCAHPEKNHHRIEPIVQSLNLYNP
jgi:CubicO group peptidase (beta-lactamase class C family)